MSCFVALFCLCVVIHFPLCRPGLFSSVLLAIIVPPLQHLFVIRGSSSGVLLAIIIPPLQHLFHSLLSYWRPCVGHSSRCSAQKHRHSHLFSVNTFLQYSRHVHPLGLFWTFVVFSSSR